MLFPTWRLTVPQGTDFSLPASTTEPSDQSVSLKSVTVTDRTFVNWNAGQTESQGLTLSLLDYLRAGQQFSVVHVPPQPIGTDDHVLSFNFDTFNVHRRPYGGYFPFALVTLTGYI